MKGADMGNLVTHGIAEEIGPHRVSPAHPGALEGPRDALRTPGSLRRLLVHVVPAPPVRVVEGEGGGEPTRAPARRGAGPRAGGPGVRGEAAGRLVRHRPAGGVFRACAVPLPQAGGRPARL